MSSSRPHLNWKVPTSEWDRFLEWVRSENGTIEGETGRAVESAMREWIDGDGYSDIEERVNDLVRAAGRTPSSGWKEKKYLSDSREPVPDGPDVSQTQVGTRVDRELKAAFKAFTSEHSEHRLGIEFAYALREYREGGRRARLEDKLDRILDDATALLSEVSDSDSGLGATERRTISICNYLPGRQFTRSDLEAAIEAATGSDTDYMRNKYVPLVLERREAVHHPGNPKLFVPAEEAAEQRRREAEAEAAEDMAALDQATPEPDGGRRRPTEPAVTDGGRDRDDGDDDGDENENETTGTDANDGFG